MYRAVRSLAATGSAGTAGSAQEVKSCPCPADVERCKGVAVAMRKALAAIAEATAFSASAEMLSDLSQSREPPAQDQALAKMRVRALDLMFGGE